MNEIGDPSCNSTPISWKEGKVNYRYVACSCLKKLLRITLSFLPDNFGATTISSGIIGDETLELNLNRKVKLKKKIRKTHHVNCFCFDQKFCYDRIIECEQK